MLKKFLSNPLVTFVGVGIDEIVEKFEKETNFKFAKTMDLRKLAGQALRKNALWNYSLEGLADLVLGYHMVVEKPKKIKWIDGNKRSQGNRANIDRQSSSKRSLSS
ncbi:hypothetical protein FRX31_024111 [Thalictrum thalictroides]|uniref:Uncharacterized protein n=1 Tax=Thalictrum thalictroides TaxID=46969 RepID=A0A7J6VPL5_THATH|nr:hypothetical protein FRX31_024111 [Thalictrum thalictroides]